MNTKKRKIIKDGVLNLAGFKIPCYVLEDGTRGLSGRQMQDALNMVDEVEKGKEKPGSILKEILGQKSLKPFVDKWLKPEGFNPIIAYKGGTEFHIYNATVLPDICNVFLALEKEVIKQRKFLPKRQAKIADRSRVVLGAVAKVGIIALIDEATGYQYERERDELQKIFKLLVLEDGIFSEAKKMFPLDYYKELFEVYDVSFTPENIRKKPRFIGWLTSELVYKNLPKGSFVLEEIKARTPKTKGGHYGKRFYRSLTPIGEKALIERINTVKTLAWVSKKNKKNKRNKLHQLVKEKFHPNRDLPYIDIDAMDAKDDLTILKESKFDKAVKALLRIPKQKKNKK